MSIFVDKKADTSKLSDGCLIAAVCTALFGGGYEYFSFGVFSFYMVYAFAFLLVGGCGFWKIVGKRRAHIPAGMACLWNAGLATLTTGSVIKGVLDIYGSSNKLVLIFLIVGLTDLVLALIIGSSKREHDIEKEGDSLLS